jgi:hypothetical protein
VTRQSELPESGGDDLLIFSDKTIDWKKGDDFGLSWSRWYRGAMEESVKQINGASRYLREHSDELFLDATRKEKFPLALPPLARRRVHHIAVALGSSEAAPSIIRNNRATSRLLLT